MSEWFGNNKYTPTKKPIKPRFDFNKTRDKFKNIQTTENWEQWKKDLLNGKKIKDNQ